MEQLIYLALAVFIGIWMFNDAKKRKQDQPAIWLIAGILFGILALIVYWFMVINPSNKKGTTKAKSSK